MSSRKKPNKVQLTHAAPIVNQGLPPGHSLEGQGKPQVRPPTVEGAQALVNLGQAMMQEQGVVPQQPPTSGVYIPGHTHPAPQPSQQVQQSLPQQTQHPASQPAPAQSAPSVPKEEDLDSDLLDEDESPLKLLNSLESRLDRFNNEARRERIEAGLRPLSADQLDDNMEYRQMVATESMRFLLRSPAHGEMEAVYRILALEAVGGMYGMNKLSSMLTCLSVVTINSKELPNHLDESLRFNRESFDKKYEFFSRYPFQIIEDARVQFAWFDDRISKMLTGEGGESGLGNG